MIGDSNHETRAATPEIARRLAKVADDLASVRGSIKGLRAIGYRVTTLLLTPDGPREVPDEKEEHEPRN